VAREAGEWSAHPAVRRVTQDVGNPDLAALLGSGIAGSDLTSLLLDVARRRADGRSPHEILLQYERDRFTRPAVVDPRVLWSLAAAAAEAIGSDFEFIELSPLVPLGTHSAVAGVSQNRVVSTVRSTEVAADPTNSLALEAAVRRRTLLRDDPRSPAIVRLAAIDRVVRAQRFEGPRSFAHFTLLGLVSAGRDLGNRRFEEQTLSGQLSALVAACRACGFRRMAVQLTDFTETHTDVVDALCTSVSSDDVSVTNWPERSAGRDYYSSLCFKLGVVENDQTIEVADGGVVAWTQTLLGNRKERLVISGLSLERLGLLRPQT
jgi:hypothetical protein